MEEGRAGSPGMLAGVTRLPAPPGVTAALPKVTAIRRPPGATAGPNGRGPNERPLGQAGWAAEPRWGSARPLPALRDALIPGVLSGKAPEHDSVRFPETPARGPAGATVPVRLCPSLPFTEQGTGSHGNERTFQNRCRALTAPAVLGSGTWTQRHCCEGFCLRGALSLRR